MLLEALALLTQDEQARVHLTLLGEHVFADYEALLLEKARGLPVTFAGPFEPADLDGSVHDLAVIPTLCHESHSFVLDEAFRLGLPLLVSDRGALVERAGRAALAFPPGDARALAGRIREILADPTGLDTLAAAIPRALVSMTEHAARILDIYRDAVKAGPPPGVRPPRVTPARLARARAVETRDHHIAELRWAVYEKPG